MFVITLWAPKSNEKAHSTVILSNKIGEIAPIWQPVCMLKSNKIHTIHTNRCKFCIDIWVQASESPKWKSLHAHVLCLFFGFAYAKIMWTCEHETNDHSIAMSLILTLPLNKRTTMAAHMQSHRIQPTRLNKLKKIKMSGSKQMRYRFWFQTKIFGPGQNPICVVCRRECICLCT